ncbi:sigma-70 RNA polymerase sigma factor region 4 domain-containing protein [Acidicapsa ligni]|uniref:hypothetical protein n=1 Tax=Acidicapsa ligni TaxID=542300 RepID=UPI0021DF489D|nr:hypothetical protein [Acidicapsa ligni]
MSSEYLSLENNLVPPAAAISGDNLLEKVAVDVYRIGSMLLGEGEEAIELAEQTVATTDVVSSDPCEIQHLSRISVAAGALDLLQHRTPEWLVPPPADSGPSSCIEDDELDAAGVSHAELEEMLSGSDAHRLREWLEELNPQLRVIFVLRAVAALSSVEVAVLLAEHGGPIAQDWTPDMVRGSFRQALCSLASQLLHASNTR